jgi:hypothetical protein
MRNFTGEQASSCVMPVRVPGSSIRSVRFHQFQASAALSALVIGSVLLGVPAQALSAAPAHQPYESASLPVKLGPIDDLVFARLQQLHIEPARPCSDAVFVRRVFLDVIGRLPTPAEAREFIQDLAPAKRSALIDRLLTREEFADYWAMKWSNLLRVKAEYPINLWPNAAQAYHRWIRSSLHDGKPFDQFARELLVANGSNFRVGPVNFYRALQSKDATSIAQSVALIFMGARTEHWPADRVAGLAGFFNQVGYKSTGEWKEEIVYWNPAMTRPAGAAPACFPDGTVATLAPGRDPRVVFADWLLAPDNPWFARAFANRVWSWLLGRGIVQEPDDFRPDNPPVNPELLAYLEHETTRSGYDLRQLFRVILNSQTYQLSCVPTSNRPEAAANFAAYPLRRLEAEVLIDAINDITGTTEKYSSAIPEPYTFIPDEARAVALPDGSITSSFLEMFGRPPRDSGLESERNNNTTAGQRLHLLNSSHIRRKLEQGPRLAGLLRGRPREVIDQLFLAILSRFPTDEERRLVNERLKPGRGNSPEVALDLAWALINTAEFLHRH